MVKAAVRRQRKGYKAVKHKSSKHYFISSAALRTICFIVFIKTTEIKTQPRSHNNKMTPHYNEF